MLTSKVGDERKLTMKIMLGLLLNLLESLDQIVNEEAQSAIGVLKDLFAKLNGKDGNTWWEMLKKFLRKEPCWVTNTVNAVVGAIVVYVVDCTLSLEEMIKAGNYDWTNSDITAKRFPLKNTGADEWEFKMFHFDRSISSENAVSGITTDDTANPWQPAAIEHLLTYGKNNPEEQRKYPIVALGSVGKVYGFRCVPYLNKDVSERHLRLGRHVPYLYEGVSGRDLDLIRWDGGWGASYRFLAVRKKVSQISVS